MIRVTLEMVPKGDDSKARILAQGVIVNDGQGTQTVGSYSYGIAKQVPESGQDPGIWKMGEVKGFRRKRDNVWRLLALVLEDALRENNNNA